MENYTQNIGKVCLYAKASCRDPQWVKLNWHWKPHIKLRKFVPMTGRKSDKGVTYPIAFSKKQGEELFKVYTLVPTTEWPSCLEGHTNNFSGSDDSDDEDGEPEKHSKLRQK